MVIDANAVLTLAITLQRLQAVARQVKIDQRGRSVQLIQLQLRLPRYPPNALTRFPSAKFRVRLSR